MPFALIPAHPSRISPEQLLRERLDQQLRGLKAAELANLGLAPAGRSLESAEQVKVALEDALSFRSQREWYAEIARHPWDHDYQLLTEVEFEGSDPSGEKTRQLRHAILAGIDKDSLYGRLLSAYSPDEFIAVPRRRKVQETEDGFKVTFPQFKSFTDWNTKGISGIFFSPARISPQTFAKIGLLPSAKIPSDLLERFNLVNREHLIPTFKVLVGSAVPLGGDSGSSRYIIFRLPDPALVKRCHLPAGLGDSAEGKILFFKEAENSFWETEALGQLDWFRRVVQVYGNLFNLHRKAGHVGDGYRDEAPVLSNTALIAETTRDAVDQEWKKGAALVVKETLHAEALRASDTVVGNLAGSRNDYKVRALKYGERIPQQFPQSPGGGTNSLAVVGKSVRQRQKGARGREDQSDDDSKRFANQVNGLRTFFRDFNDRLRTLDSKLNRGLVFFTGRSTPAIIDSQIRAFKIILGANNIPNPDVERRHFDKDGNTPLSIVMTKNHAMWLATPYLEIARALHKDFDGLLDGWRERKLTLANSKKIVERLKVLCELSLEYLDFNLNPEQQRPKLIEIAKGLKSESGTYDRVIAQVPEVAMTSKQKKESA